MVSVRVTQVRDSEATMLWQVNRPGHLPIEAAALSMPDLLAIACHYGKVQHLVPMRLERRLSAMQAFAKLVMARMRAAPRKARECTEGVKAASCKCYGPPWATSRASPTCSTC
jgi:hypothetical protein